MKGQIKVITKTLVLFSFLSFAYSQGITFAATRTAQSDVTDLKTLVFKLLRWHDTDKGLDFSLLKDPKGTTYVGIDWQAHKKRMAKIEKTSLFTKYFLDNYQRIALHLDKELKQNKIKYIVGELTPYGNGAYEWCNCQDYPGEISEIWKRLKIVTLKIDEKSASFKWTWGDEFFYSVKARRENGGWKIAELERFNVKGFSW